jgi:hypothetical protein
MMMISPEHPAWRSRLHGYATEADAKQLKELLARSRDANVDKA